MLLGRLRTLPDTGFLRGMRSRMSTCKTSPGSAPHTYMGPVMMCTPSPGAQEQIKHTCTGAVGFHTQHGCISVQACRGGVKA